MLTIVRKTLDGRLEMPVDYIFPGLSFGRLEYFIEVVEGVVI